jgi:hypothetical protein
LVDVEAVSEHPNLAPRVPVGRDDDLVSVDDVVPEWLLLEDRVYPQAGVDQGGKLGGNRRGGVD